MATIKDTIMFYQILLCLFFILFAAIIPVVAKIFVNNSIEKRYNCKLNLENENMPRVFLYDYFKLAYPASAIALTYLLKTKSIQKHPGLNAINFNIKTATKQELLVSCSIVIIGAFSLLIISIQYLISKFHPF